MKLQYHIASSTLAAGIVYLSFKSWSMTLSCFLSGIFIDLDHIYDYIREVGFPFKLKDLFKAAYNAELNRWMLVLHSWELLFLLGIIAWFMNWNPWVTGILIGFGHHILLDKLHTGDSLFSYSFIWRWKYHFEYVTLFPNDARKKRQTKYSN